MGLLGPRLSLTPPSPDSPRPARGPGPHVTPRGRQPPTQRQGSRAALQPRPDGSRGAAGPGRAPSGGFREDHWILSPTTYGFAVWFAAVAAAEWAIAAVAGAGLSSVFRSEPPSPPAPWECSVPPAWRCPWPPSAAPPPSRGVPLPRSGSRENRLNNGKAASIYSSVPFFRRKGCRGFSKSLHLTFFKGPSRESVK